MGLFRSVTKATGKAAITAGKTAFPGGLWGDHADREQTTGGKVARSVGLFTPVDGTKPKKRSGWF